MNILPEAKDTITPEILKLATEALEIQKQANGLLDSLDLIKNQFREYAQGQKFNMVVEGLGKIDVSKPRESTQSVTIQLNKEKLDEHADVKAKLLKAGIIAEIVSNTSAAKASVSIKPNV